MHGLDTFAGFAATYDSLDAAETDYDAIKDLYYKEQLLDTFDAAVISKDENGKVKIVKKHEQPLRQGAWVSGGLGLATGLCVALFPAVAVGAGIMWGAGIGAGLGALAGHAAGGMSRSDLKDLGETLDSGQSAVVAVAAAAIADRVAESLKNAEKIDRRSSRQIPKRSRTTSRLPTRPASRPGRVGDRQGQHIRDSETLRSTRPPRQERSSTGVRTVSEGDHACWWAAIGGVARIAWDSMPPESVLASNPC